MLIAALVLAAAPIALDPAVGHVHFLVSTQNAEAQSYFDQGMAYLYGFNHETAIRSFQKAGELDPDLAMAWWGVALALGPNINVDVDPDREKQAYDAVQTALTKKMSPKEHDIITTLALRYSNDPKADLKKLSADYSAAMGELSKKYPEDLDIAVLYAESMMDLRPWKFWTHDGKPAPGTEQIVSVLESVLKRDPNHLGANHYYIHAVEASPHPERALKSAGRLPTLAPASGHLVHMPAHIYQRTGNYAGAAKANENAAATDRKFIERNGAEGLYALMYFNHNLQFGTASYQMDGRFADAKRMGDEFGANAAAAAKQMPMLEAAAATSILVLVRFSKWTDVIKAPPADSGPMSSTLSHFARGTAFAKLRDVSSAERERQDFEAARKMLTDDPGFYQNSPKMVAAVAMYLLNGRIFEAHGHPREAIESYQAAVNAQDSLDYDEPADWFYPTRETLGAALIRHDRYAEAEKVLREDLKRNPNNPRSLFLLAEAQKKQKEPWEDTMEAFKSAWKGGTLKIADM